MEDATGVPVCEVVRFPYGAMGRLFFHAIKFHSIPCISALRRQRLEGHELKDSLGYVARP